MDSKEVRFTCPYCKNNLEETFGWKSHFSGHQHYKGIKCNCGKEVWLKVNFAGSGDDTWDGKESWVSKEKQQETTQKQESKIKQIETNSEAETQGDLDKLIENNVEES